MPSKWNQMMPILMRHLLYDKDNQCYCFCYCCSHKTLLKIRSSACCVALNLSARNDYWQHYSNADRRFIREQAAAAAAEKTTEFTKANEWTLQTSEIFFFFHICVSLHCVSVSSVAHRRESWVCVISNQCRPTQTNILFSNARRRN